MDQFCTNFWIEAHADLVISKAAFHVLILVATSYMCEAGFPAVAVLKTKYYSKLDVECEMRFEVLNIASQFKAFCQNKRANVSY